MSKHHISQETLYAYVDNELDPAGSAQVEAAMASDPELASRIEEQRNLRSMLGSAYSPVLEEPVPPRLVAAAQATMPRPSAKVLKLASARASKKTLEAEKPPANATNDWSWKHWGGMAACLAIGVFAGHSAWLSTVIDDIASHDGQLVARGQLAQALSTQLASAQTSDAPVKIGLSYVSKADEYCRSFTVKSAGTDGIACRSGNDWAVRVVEQNKPKPSADANLRMAASPVPAAVMKVVDDQIQGSPLDAQAERAAMNKGWRGK